MDNNDTTKTRDYTYIDDNGDLHNATLIYDVYHPKYLFRATSGLDELDEYGNLLTKGARSEKGEKVDMTMATHVEKTQDRTPWISTSLDIAPLKDRNFLKSDQQGQLVAVFNGEQYTNGDNMFDLSTPSKLHNWIDYNTASCSPKHKLPPIYDKTDARAGQYKQVSLESYPVKAKECLLYGKQPSQNFFLVSQEELQRALYVTATYDEEKDRQVFHPDKAVDHLLLTHHFGEQTENMSEYREYKQQAKELGISPESLLYQNSNAYKNHFSEQWNTKDFSNSVIERVNFNGLSLDGFKFNDCTFKNCTFDHTRLARSNFVNAKFINCEINDTSMSQSNLSHAGIYDSIIDNVRFSDNTWLNNITVSNCTINQVTGSRIRMSDLDVNDSEITDVDFRKRNALKNNCVFNSKIENIKVSEHDKPQFLVDSNTEIVNNNNIEINHDMTEKNNGPAYHMSLGRS